jgi:putative ABC transport system substrate-binding protein
VVTGSLSAVLAVKAATTTIPIVFAVGVDPVKYGLVASFNRPGGNLTGVNFRSLELATKRIEFLSELVPQVTTIAFLAGGSRFLTFEEQTNDMHAAARALGRQIIVSECRSEQDFDSAFTGIVDQSAGALVVGAFPLFFDGRNGDKILQLATRHKNPAIYPIRTYVIAGGLMSYSTSIGLYRQLGLNYVGRILNGSKPADLPVEQASKFALSINLKTAKALGLDVPQTLLAAADEVIE